MRQSSRWHSSPYDVFPIREPPRPLGAEDAALVDEVGPPATIPVRDAIAHVAVVDIDAVIARAAAPADVLHHLVVRWTALHAGTKRLVADALVAKRRDEVEGLESDLEAIAFHIEKTKRKRIVEIARKLTAR